MRFEIFLITILSTLSTLDNVQWTTLHMNLLVDLFIPFTSMMTAMLFIKRLFVSFTMFALILMFLNVPKSVYFETTRMNAFDP